MNKEENRLIEKYGPPLKPYYSNTMANQLWDNFVPKNYNKTKYVEPKKFFRTRSVSESDEDDNTVNDRRKKRSENMEKIETHRAKDYKRTRREKSDVKSVPKSTHDHQYSSSIERDERGQRITLNKYLQKLRTQKMESIIDSGSSSPEIGRRFKNRLIDLTIRERKMDSRERSKSKSTKLKNRLIDLTSSPIEERKMGSRERSKSKSTKLKNRLTDLTNSPIEERKMGSRERSKSKSTKLKNLSDVAESDLERIKQIRKYASLMKKNEKAIASKTKSKEFGEPSHEVREEKLDSRNRRISVLKRLSEESNDGNDNRKKPNITSSSKLNSLVYKRCKKNWRVLPHSSPRLM